MGFRAGTLTSQNTTIGAHCLAADPTSTLASGDKTVEKQGTPKKRHQDVMWKRVPHIKIAFGRSSIRRCTITVVFVEVKKTIFGMELLVAEFKSIVDLLMFSMQSKEWKEYYADRFGPAAICFRRVVIKNVWHHVIFSTLEMFKQRRDLKWYSGLACPKQFVDNVIEKPLCLRAPTDTVRAYVTSVHIYTIHMHMEGLGLDAGYCHRFAIAARACPVRQENVYHAISCLNSNMFSKMKIMHHSICKEYFETLGYLFVSWSNVGGCRVGND